MLTLSIYKLHVTFKWKYSMLMQWSAYIKHKQHLYRAVVESGFLFFDSVWKWKVSLNLNALLFFFFFLIQEPHSSELQGHCCDCETWAQGNRLPPGDWTGSPDKCKDTTYTFLQINK